MSDIPPALFAFFERMPRQGPGSADVTAALYRRFWPMLPEIPAAADMGCGSGAAGLVLAELGALVTGVDIHRPFLDAFEKRAHEHGLGDRVSLIQASMTESGIGDKSLDLVWSEGAVFTVGFEVALKEFARLLKSGGLAVVSESTWLRNDAPPELKDFWTEAYPGMGTVAGNLDIAGAAGWRFLHADVLDPEVWEQGFYGPMEHLIADIEAGHDDDLKAIARDSTIEIEMFRRYHDYVGYVFYVLQKP